MTAALRLGGMFQHGHVPYLGVNLTKAIEYYTEVGGVWGAGWWWSVRWLVVRWLLDSLVVNVRWLLGSLFVRFVGC